MEGREEVAQEGTDRGEEESSPIVALVQTGTRIADALEKLASDPENEMTKWAYLAGVIDGEGSVTYNAHSVSLRITQADKNIVLLDWVAELFGEIEIVFSWFEGRHEKSVHSTITVNEQASLKTVLLLTIPYLTLKKDRAIEALAFLGAKDRAREYRDTHCVNGHLRTPENTAIETSHVKGRSWKRCKICKSQSAKRARQRVTH